MEDISILQLKEYAKKKKELLNSIYDITKHSVFLGDRSEVEKFVQFLNMREPYIKELEMLNEQTKGALNRFEMDFKSKDADYRDVSQLLSEAQSIKMKILELDKRNNENMQKLTDSLRVEVRNINISKKARNSYNFFQAQAHDNI